MPAIAKPTTAKKKVVAPRFKDAVKNILTIFSHATSTEIAEGKVWYNEANDFAKQQAEKFGFSVEIVAGIISSLSPGTDWERNKADALQVLANNSGHKFGTYGPNVAKAFKILNSDSAVNVATFFPANKTYNFYQNIINPSDSNFVTVDRHALAIANGCVREDKSITNVEYRELATAYNKAAKKVGLLPCELQAISWVLWRRAKGYKSQFNISDLGKVRATAN